jgi:anthranilate synthase/aminodeoxychorismate synthase-like glutamine amidotransferase
MILLIDNYDSFTYNLAQALESLAQEVQVFRNDQITISGIEEKHPAELMISPGPGAPSTAGISIEVVRHFGARIPLIGVCLGHQAIAEAFGARIVRSDRIMHGKTSLIYHDDKQIYQGIPNPFEAVRYHSLIVEKETLPNCFEITAWTEQGEIMGIRHKEYFVEGVQFHPESILTKNGPKLLHNFIIQGTYRHD